MLPPLLRSLKKELLDRDGLDPEDLRSNLLDLGRVSRWGGGATTVLSRLSGRLDAWPRQRPLRILDVGAGGADLCLALADACRRRGIGAWIVGVDRSHPILEFARSQVEDRPGIALARGNALALPFLPQSFDFVVCSLVLHHLAPEQAPAFLRGLTSLAREAVLVSDLRRGRWEYFWVFLFSRIFLRGRMTRNDGPLSVLRSLTIPEARALADEAGWAAGRVEKVFPLRLLLVDRPL